jgi:hypothetical protein
MIRLLVRRFRDGTKQAAARSLENFDIASKTVTGSARYAATLHSDFVPEVVLPIADALRYMKRILSSVA